MKPRQDGKLTLSFNADAEIRDWLLRRSAELTVKENRRVTMGNVIVDALEKERRKTKK